MKLHKRWVSWNYIYKRLGLLVSIISLSAKNVTSIKLRSSYLHVIFHIHSLWHCAIVGLWQGWVGSFVISLASEVTWQDLREVNFRKVMLHAESCCWQFGLQRQKVVNILPKSRRSSNLSSKSCRTSWAVLRPFSVGNQLKRHPSMSNSRPPVINQANSE